MDSNASHLNQCTAFTFSVSMSDLCKNKGASILLCVIVVAIFVFGFIFLISKLMMQIHSRKIGGIKS